MARSEPSLWPFGSRGALLAAPLIWIAIGLSIALIHHWFQWPNKDSGNAVLLVAAALGLVPTLLAVFDYIASSRAAVDIKGIKIDFGRGEVKQVTLELPPNLVQTGAAPTDSSPLEISSVLDSALGSASSTVTSVTSNPVIRIDLGKGDEWWVSRLLVLTAGAIRTGVPGAIAFIGDNPRPHSFLGWTSPAETLTALMEDAAPRGRSSLTYQDLYLRAVRIAKLLDLFSDTSPAFPPWPGKALPVDVQNYLQNPQYASLGEAAMEQILMDLIFQYGIENPPDQLTFWRLQELFVHHPLYTQAVDLSKPEEEQTRDFLNSDTPYIALVRDGRYEGVTERADVERVALRKLVRRT